MTFPVMPNFRASKQLPDVPREVPFSWLQKYEKKVIDNHGQTLLRLRERGGLSPAEIYCAVKDIPFDETVIVPAYQWLATEPWKELIDFSGIQEWLDLSKNHYEKLKIMAHLIKQ